VPSRARVGCALALAVALVAPAAGAATLRAEPGSAAAVLAAAQPGDTVVLARGVHPGTLLVLRRIVLRGEPGAVIDGSHATSALEIAAGGTVVEDVRVSGSGRDVMRVDAGVHVIACTDVVLRRLRNDNTLYGVYGERAHGLALEHCDLRGTVAPLDESGTGNGIHLWYCDHVRIESCRVQRFLDAIYLSFAAHADVERSQMSDCGRYGFHTMYCQEGRLVGNRFARNVAGCAIMFSNRLEVVGNEFVHNRGPRTYGLLLRDCSDGAFTGNRLIDNTVGVFMDNSNRNVFRSNLLEDNGWGVLLFASCARDTFAENDFVQNDYPVALDMSRTQNRFDDGVAGNYWSDSAPYDLDDDGVSDVPHYPVTAFAFVSKQYPDLTLLARSPAVAALGAAERMFPSLQPSDAVDRRPHVAPIVLAAAEAAAPWRARPAPAWPAAAAFGGLGVLGIAGIAAGRGRRP
jgi:nitrous oxidase accessory protein